MNVPGEKCFRLYCRCLSFSLSSLFQLSFFIFHTKLENATNSTCFIHLLQRSCAYVHMGAWGGGGGAKIALRALFSYSEDSYFFICNAIRTAVHSSMPYRGETSSLPERRAATPFSFMSTAAQKVSSRHHSWLHSFFIQICIQYERYEIIFPKFLFSAVKCVRTPAIRRFIEP